MKIKYLTIALIFLFAICFGMFLSGCANPEINPLDDRNATILGINNTVDANNQFAFDYYDKLKESDSNIFFSPYSISSALTMTYEGAKGQTAEEIKNVFYISANDSDRRSAFARTYNQLNHPNENRTLKTANALWLEQNFPFVQEYKNTMGAYYGGEANNINFIGQPESSRIQINSWVEDQTNDKIKDLIPEGEITSDTRFVITNAIYFKGKWDKEFNKESTRDMEFRITPANKIQTKMMTMSGERFNYAETNDLQILELPYKGKDLSMILLLPKQDNIKSLEETLTSQKLSELRNQLYSEQVDIYIPKFKFETKYNMKETLIDLGMPTAFTPVADFSGLGGNPGDLMISQVIHQAFVEVNEEGTEAAAATGVIGKATSIGPGPEPKLFKADHPFIFIIQQKETGNILFMGRVNNPA